MRPIFFNGFKAYPLYALECVATAYIHGACWVVLCDSNGSTLLHEVSQIVEEVAKALPSSHIGIRFLNDSDSAVAAALAAVRAWTHYVQGTFNGLGVRCGNANLASVISNLMLKMGYETAVMIEALNRLTAVSQQIDARLNWSPASRAPYVGADAFSLRDGLSTLDTTTAAHIGPQPVGNQHRLEAEGARPVHALDVALRKSLDDAYPNFSELRLVDYKMRILNSEGGTKARIRVMIDSSDGVDNWSTVGVSDNLIDASYSAFNGGVAYKLLRDELKRQAVSGGSEAPDGKT